jgi:carbon-monoxide dehydrogenase medium subunit
VAASAWIDPERQVFVEPRIALGAVAPTVMRTPKAEAWLEGRRADQEAMAEAGRIAAGEAKPISDFRASAGYRRDLIRVLTARALAQTVAQAAARSKEVAR